MRNRPKSKERKVTKARPKKKIIDGNATTGATTEPLCQQYNIVHLYNRPSCCDRPELICNYAEGCFVCVNCGLVDDSDRVYELYDRGSGSGDARAISQALKTHSPASINRYKPIHYWNEIMARFQLLDPDLPDEVVDALEEAQRKYFPDHDHGLSKKEARKLVSLASPPEGTTKAEMERRYKEKWIRIRARLYLQYPPELTKKERGRIDCIFLRFLEAFNRCNFDKTGTFRKNIISYNYMALRAFWLIGRPDCMEYFEYPKCAKARKKCDDYFKRMCNIMKDLVPAEFKTIEEVCKECNVVFI